MPPIRQLDRNPHYLEYQGRPIALVGSGEHYGAVLNLDFDYERYLDALAGDGLNLTRTFTGSYREIPGSFGIADNTLAPQPDRFIAPWARADRPLREKEGPVFDLERWDEAYFTRLRDFLSYAARKGVVVELVMFCFLYNDRLWQANPFHPANNVNDTEDPADRHDVYRMGCPRIQASQEAMVRKIVTECNGYDNFYFEIHNEPYSTHDAQDFRPWQNRIIDVIVETEQGLPNRHLIAQNVNNRTMRVTDLHEAVDIVSFHYAEPSAVWGNYHLGKVIADDETGFKGQSPTPYRREAWHFMLAGGGVFSHLDYSFTPSDPAGEGTPTANTPGWGGPEWRRQLRVLAEFLAGFDLPAMSPAEQVLNNFVGGGSAAAGVRVLAETGRQYAVYVDGGGPRIELGLGLPAGSYRAEWVHPAMGHVMAAEQFDHPGGSHAFRSPFYAEDLALRILAQA